MVYKVRVETDFLKSKQERGYRVRRSCEGPLGEEEIGGRSSRQEQGHSGCRAGGGWEVRDAGERGGGRGAAGGSGEAALLGR